MKFKADAAANLDQRLANLLISAAAGGGRLPPPPPLQHTHTHTLHPRMCLSPPFLTAGNKPGLEKGSTASKYATEEPKEALLGKKSAKKNSVAPDIAS